MPPYLLIADDDQDDLDMLTEAFVRQNPGYLVEHVSGGKAVLQYLDKTTELPAMLVLDYQMPDLNGPEVLQRLAADRRYTGLLKVIWSTSRRVKDMEDCKRLGAAHYLIKPGDSKELSSIIHQITLLLEFGPGGYRL